MTYDLHGLINQLGGERVATEQSVWITVGEKGGRKDNRNIHINFGRAVNFMKLINKNVCTKKKELDEVTYKVLVTS